MTCRAQKSRLGAGGDSFVAGPAAGRRFATYGAAGGVTVRAVLYVLFFLVGVAMFGVLAVWFHRHRQPGWISAVAGLAGAPLLLGLLLAVAPAILGRWGLLPA